MNKINEGNKILRMYSMYGNMNPHLLYEDYYNAVLDHISLHESCNYTYKFEYENYYLDND